MYSQSVLTLGLLFCLSFGAVWDVTRAYMQQEPESDESAESKEQTRGTTFPDIMIRLANTQRSKRSKDQVDDSAIVFPKDEGNPKCEDTHTCSTLEDCHPFSKKNSICGWNGNLPRVCCLKNQTKMTPDNHIISENDCFRRVEIKQIVPITIAVVGGTGVLNNAKWPFMVGLFLRIGKNRTFICGGSLISRKHVLTAAHCFQSKDAKYDVINGLVDLKSIENNAEPFTIHPVTNVRLHPNFKSPQLYDDIALLTIPSIDSFSHITRPVCLPLPLQENGDTGTGTLIGWGQTKFRGQTSDLLQVAEMDFVNRPTCEKAFKETDWSFTRSYPRGILPGIICAGNTFSPEDACKGDSGGPLVVLDNDNVWRLVGVVSSGFKCGVVGVPGIYTRVNKYLDWIKATAAID